MSERRPTLARMHARFVGRFLAPLLGGGELEVSRPIPPAALESFAAMAIPDAEWERAIASGLDRAARALLGHPCPRVGLSRGAQALAIAAHDLLASTDPLLDRPLARPAIAAALDYAEALVGTAGDPASREDVLARHAIVTALSVVEREDAQVHLWFGGSYGFAGREVPKRLVAWPRLRRVREERRRIPVSGLFDSLGPEHASRASRIHFAIGLASPLTELVTGDPARPAILGGGALSVLRDPLLRRAVVHALAEGRLPAIGRLAGGLVERLDADVQPALATLVEAVALVALEGPRFVGEGALGPLESIALGAFAASIESDASPLASGLGPRDRARLVAFAALLEPRALHDGLARGRALVHRAAASTRATAMETEIP